jgi:hypothetical protein
MQPGHEFKAYGHAYWRISQFLSYYVTHSSIPGLGSDMRELVRFLNAAQTLAPTMIPTGAPSSCVVPGMPSTNGRVVPGQPDFVWCYNEVSVGAAHVESTVIGYSDVRCLCYARPG